MKQEQRATVLITGANKGIGLETARRLAELGMTVLVAARDHGRGASAVASLRAKSPDVHLVLLDVADEASVARAAADVTARFGRLDVLVNNAAIALGTGRPSKQASVPMGDLFATNVLGPLAVTQAFLPLLEKAPAARIVNVSASLGSLRLWADPDSRMSQFSDFFGYIIGGAVIGLLARLLKPGADPMGWIVTILLGIVGAVIGGQVAVMLNIGSTMLTWVIAIGAAIVLLFVYEAMRKKR